MSLHGDPNTIYTYITRPYPPRLLPHYVPAFPELLGPLDLAKKPLGPETIKDFQRRYNRQVKTWERRARSGKVVWRFAELSVNLKLPVGLNQQLLIQPDPAWIAQKAERSVFANLGNNSISADAFALAIQQSADGMPSADGSQPWVVTSYGVPAVLDVVSAPVVDAPVAVYPAPRPAILPELPELPELPVFFPPDYVFAPIGALPLPGAAPPPQNSFAATAAALFPFSQGEIEDPTGEWTLAHVREYP